MTKKIFLNQFPAIAYALAIFVQSSFPGTSFPKVDLLNADKLVHAVIYFVLTFSICHALVHQRRYGYVREHWFVCAFLIATLYALSDETHQYFTPNRSAEIMDMNADVLGIVLALFVFKRFPTKELG